MDSLQCIHVKRTCFFLLAFIVLTTRSLFYNGLREDLARVVSRDLILKVSQSKISQGVLEIDLYCNGHAALFSF